jgi:hypothetical protein
MAARELVARGYASVGFMASETAIADARPLSRLRKESPNTLTSRDAIRFASDCLF